MGSRGEFAIAQTFIFRNQRGFGSEPCCQAVDDQRKRKVRILRYGGGQFERAQPRLQRRVILLVLLDLESSFALFVRLMRDKD